MQMKLVETDEPEGRSDLPLWKITPQHFLPLINDIMAKRHITHRQLAKLTGINESRISRLLNSRQPFDVLTMNRITEALEIDIMRALLAVGRFGDWRQYFDLDVEIIADLIDVLPNRLAQARSANERTRISAAGTLVLAEKLCDMIVTNDRETIKRRRERPLAGF